MATQLFAKSEQELSTYLPAYKDILSATGWVDLKTGETKTLSAEQKILWLYCLDRYKFFKDSGKLWFDNQIDIGSACGVSERTIRRFFTDLKKAGYLKTTQTRVGGHLSNSYEINRDLVLVQKLKEHSQKAPQAAVAPSDAVSVPDDAPAFDALDNALDDAVPAGADWACEAVPLDAYDAFNPDTEDDGSAGDAFAYEAFEALPATKEEKPIIVKAPTKTAGALQFDDMPGKRFHPSGRVSDEMMAWCKVNNITYREGEYDFYWTIKGKDYVLNKGEFVPCTSKPALLPRPKLEDFESLF